MLVKTMEEIKRALVQHGFKGDVDDSAETLNFYSHDASMFEIRPRLVIAMGEVRRDQFFLGHEVALDPITRSAW